jgi:hypothetical protein
MSPKSNEKEVYGNNWLGIRREARQKGARFG